MRQRGKTRGRIGKKEQKLDSQGKRELHLERDTRVRGTKAQRGVRGIGGARYQARAQQERKNEMLEREGMGFFYSASLTLLYHLHFLSIDSFTPM